MQRKNFFFLFTLFSELERFLGEIKTDNLTVSTVKLSLDHVDFTTCISKNRIVCEIIHLVVY